MFFTMITIKNTHESTAVFIDEAHVICRFFVSETEPLA